MAETRERSARGRRGRAARASRRGVTFLEAVFATALLSIIAASVFAAADFLIRSDQRHRQTLACAELANRLILQYLDDKSQMPSESAPIEYGPDRFRFRVEERPLNVREFFQRARAGSGGGANRMARMVDVRVTVWLGEDSGGAMEPGAGVPGVSLSRLMDPLAFRNPDAINRMLSTDAGMQQLMERVMGGGGGSATRPPAGSGSTREQTPTREERR